MISTYLNIVRLISPKTINLFLIISSFIGYMEWGKDKSMFVIQGEIEIFFKFFTNPMSVLHPLILLPLFGQIILCITLVQKKPKQVHSLIGFGCITLLMYLLLFIGLMSLNGMVIISTLPFVLTSIVFVVQYWSNKTGKTHKPT